MQSNRDVQRHSFSDLFVAEKHNRQTNGELFFFKTKYFENSMNYTFSGMSICVLTVIRFRRSFPETFCMSSYHWHNGLIMDTLTKTRKMSPVKMG